MGLKFLIVVFLVLTSCVQDQEKKSIATTRELIEQTGANEMAETHQSLPVSIDAIDEEHVKLQAELHERYDTVLSSGYFLKYHLDGYNMIVMQWGNKKFSRTIKDEKYPGRAPSDFDFEWKNFIGMSHHIGTGGVNHYLLPKNNRDSIAIYNNPLAFDTKNSLILHRDWKHLKKNQVIVENIDTKNRKYVKLDLLDDCPHCFWADHIDSASIINKNLYIRWQTRCAYTESPQKKEIRLKLEL